MQYTSLKDKNGKEIWEGDIVKDSFGEKAEIKWFDGTFVVGVPYQILHQYVDIEVIGNIYENPDLLQD